MNEGEGEYIPDNVIENEDKAQLEANLVRIKALQRAANDEFLRSNPTDYQMLSVCRDCRNFGIEMNTEQQRIFSDLENKLAESRKKVISGEIQVEPTRDDYEAASDLVAELDEWQDKGPVAKVIFGLIRKLAESGSTKALLKRTENIENQVEPS